MIIQLKKTDGLALPAKANPVEDAGFDLIATSDPNIVGEKEDLVTDELTLWRNIQYVEYETNVCIAPELRAIYPELADGEMHEGGPIGFDVWHSLLFPRSSVSKQNLVLANSVGLVDNGYRNQILVRFKYVWQPCDFVLMPEMNNKKPSYGTMKVFGVLNRNAIYKKGDKIIQLVPFQGVQAEFKEVSELPSSKRGLGGWGSTGR